MIDAANGLGLRTKNNGKTAQIQAPGHSNADLSVTLTDIGGQVLLYSHSDPTDTVLDALGLSMADLFDEPKGVTYTYGDSRQVHRSPLKKFSQSGNTKGTQLYRADKLAAASVVFFVEGEKDVHALEAAGATATCTAMGAGKAHMFDLTPLHGKHVRIVRDLDDAGMKHAEQVAGILMGKAASVKLLTAVEGKDAADHIGSGHTLDEFHTEEFPAPVETIDPEFEREVEGLIRYERAKTEARNRQSAAHAVALNPKLLRDILAMDVTYDWLVEGLLEVQDRLILTGGEGAGKSYLTRQLAISIAAGVHPFRVTERIEPRRVLVIDAENTERQWARNTRYVTALTGQHGRGKPGENVLVSAGTRLNFKLQADVDNVHKLMDEFKPSVLYIGPLYKLLDGAVNNDDDAAPLIMALDSFRERGVALLMEAHAGHAKSLGGERDLRPRGSSQLLGWPEFGLGLRAMEEDDDMATLVHWRGDRDVRNWPTRLRRGVEGEMPWMPA
ncbi:AAA family ATPase [Frigoribacterium faeni]|uniref:5S rRNA maturation endonuclease (Ribonuclease M5) n=1 Tax=Frigoribacterium faeni TaxID=145483 RepID=A0A7W3JGZ0_9MICO|nr:AAA family ATPase [Frigoribacterium faeni]MBA8812687.1 5S rRNA maturation endonuclease (ribonuclease M5) [Frigoribacterium faeni]